jgi:hypothetical protein
MAWHSPQNVPTKKKIASLNLFGRIQIMLHSYKPLALYFCFVVSKALDRGLYQNNGQSAM